MSRRRRARQRSRCSRRRHRSKPCCRRWLTHTRALAREGRKREGRGERELAHTRHREMGRAASTREGEGEGERGQRTLQLLCVRVRVAEAEVSPLLSASPIEPATALCCPSPLSRAFRSRSASARHSAIGAREAIARSSAATRARGRTARDELSVEGGARCKAQYVEGDTRWWSAAPSECTAASDHVPVGDRSSDRAATLCALRSAWCARQSARQSAAEVPESCGRVAACETSGQANTAAL